MLIDRLTLERETYGPNKGQLTGRVRFVDKSETTVELNLTPALSERFLKVVGDAVQDAAKELSAKLTANLACFSSTALPAPGDD